MKGADSHLGMAVRYCLVTGMPANKSKFYRTLKRISPELALVMSKEVEYTPSEVDGCSTSG